MTVDPNPVEEEPLSKSDGGHTASTVVGLLLVATVFALIYFYVLPASASTQCGDASWYEAKSNSSGSFTAAHRSLPFGSKIHIENLDNGHKAMVEINDRGPFIQDRIIDVSRAAAEQLGFTGDGIARVRISTVGPSTVTCR
jgi:rare lipoprotein A